MNETVKFSFLSKHKANYVLLMAGDFGVDCACEFDTLSKGLGLLKNMWPASLHNTSGKLVAHSTKEGTVLCP